MSFLSPIIIINFYCKNRTMKEQMHFKRNSAGKIFVQSNYHSEIEPSNIEIEYSFKKKKRSYDLLLRRLRNEIKREVLVYRNHIHNNHIMCKLSLMST